MENMSRELALAIHMVKILSGKEEANHNPTRLFFEEIKESLHQEMTAPLVHKSWYFFTMFLQKDYSQLLMMQ